MDSSDSRKASSKPRPAPATQAEGGGRASEDAFGLWLQRGLHQLYDSVANEPIPDELLRLIEADKDRKGGA
ncbi:hypothetical protein G3576_08225 [Roseomonas stagni]|uniref:Anti-sigma factor NepR domain-containing protein n=2 Tax=Falsiroseomonas algicola TaxID=2716930 RepID=A0A6M1LI26_9PROT|nr:hypothetical protein [Falsiroseomonas algicola]